MGFRFRKSINLLFFRINFSKSGIGWSVAPIPGFVRFTRSVTRQRYWTFSIPGTGLAYQTKRKKTSAAE